MTKRKKKKSKVEVYQIKPAPFYASFSLAKYQPVEVGTFATNRSGGLVDCNTAVFPQLLQDVKLPQDLNVGLEEHYKSKEKKSAKKTTPLWHTFLRWICQSEFDLSGVDVVARRGILKHIGYTLYNFHDNPWSFKICKYQGKLYMYETESGAMCEPDEMHKKFMYWGRRFETCVTTDPSVTPDPSVTSAAGGNCYSMVTGDIGKYRVLLAAEIDAVRPRGTTSSIGATTENCDVSEAGNHLTDLHLNPSEAANRSPQEYIELKTCVERTVRNKLCYGWLQSYLAGIETLYYGFRDDVGYLNKTREYVVSEVPALCKWDGGAMFGLMSGLVNWAFTRVEEGTSGTLLYLGDKKEVMLTHDGPHFLPFWYTQYLDTLATSLPPQ